MKYYPLWPFFLFWLFGPFYEKVMSGSTEKAQDELRQLVPSKQFIFNVYDLYSKYAQTGVYHVVSYEEGSIKL